MSTDKFTLVGGDTDFSSRTKNIFADLELLETKHCEFENSDEVRCESAALLKCDPTDELLLSVHQNSSHSFAVPALPPPKKKICLNVPEFESNPAGWKLYDLSDISVNQLSESSNVRAAHDFMDTQNTYKRSLNDEHEVEKLKCRSTENVRHIFHKPQHKIAVEIKSIKSATNEVRSTGLVSVSFDDDVAHSLSVVNELQTGTSGVDHTETDDVELTSTSDVQLTGHSKLMFPSHNTGRCRTERRQQVRYHTADSDEDDDESDDVITTAAAVTVASSMSATQPVATATNFSSKIIVADDDDEFSELAQLSSDSEEDEKHVIVDCQSQPSIDRQVDLLCELHGVNLPCDSYTDLETVD